MYLCSMITDTENQLNSSLNINYNYSSRIYNVHKQNIARFFQKHRKERTSDYLVNRKITLCFACAPYYYKSCI